MNATVSYLRQFVTPDMLKSTEDELATSYKLTQDDRIIAALFIKLFPLTMSVYQKYDSIEEDAVISSSMMMIRDMSKVFDVNKKVKFTTYYTGGLKRLLLTLRKPQTYKKRTCPAEVVSLSEPVFYDKLGETFDTCDSTIQDFLADTVDLYRRSDSELFVAINEYFDPMTAQIIICLAQGYSKSETANLLNIDVKCVHATIRKNKDALKLILK